MSNPKVCRVVVDGDIIEIRYTYDPNTADIRITETVIKRKKKGFVFR